jgi:hypothetical protein
MYRREASEDTRYMYIAILNGVHLVLANMFVGAKHDRIQYGIITNNLSAVMLRPLLKNEMHPLNDLRNYCRGKPLVKSPDR